MNVVCNPRVPIFISRQDSGWHTIHTFQADWFENKSTLLQKYIPQFIGAKFTWNTLIASWSLTPDIGQHSVIISEGLFDPKMSKILFLCVGKLLSKKIHGIA